MEHKPVHIITNLTVNQFLQRAAISRLDVEAIAEDSEGSQDHIHAYLTWPVDRDNYGRTVLKPKKTNWCRGVHRKFGCATCRNSCGGARCPTCNLYIKAIWPKNPEHVENIKRYIERKAGALLRGEDGNFHRRQPTEGEFEEEDYSPDTS